MATSTFRNSMDFWEDQVERALNNLDSKIQAVIALHPIAEKFSIEDFEKQDHEYPIKVFLEHYSLEELHNTGGKESGKSVEDSYAKLKETFEGYRKNGLAEEDREGIKALLEETEEREYEISVFLSTLRELADAHPNVF